MKRGRALILASLCLLLGCSRMPVPETSRSADASESVKKVTVTLVRWPYT